MSDAEIKKYIDKIEAGLLESRKQLLKEYALHGDSVVIGDGHGNVMDIPAREMLAKHPELVI